MGLLADALKEHGGSNPCSVTGQVETLDAETATEFNEYVQAVREWRSVHGIKATGGPNARELRRALLSIGLRCSLPAVQDHLAGRCGCG